MNFCAIQVFKQQVAAEFQSGHDQVNQHNQPTDASPEVFGKCRESTAFSEEMKSLAPPVTLVCARFFYLVGCAGSSTAVLFARAPAAAWLRRLAPQSAGRPASCDGFQQKHVS
jgi:hypothetical protein